LTHDRRHDRPAPAVPAAGTRRDDARADGLGECDARRPLTPSGTNILGLVKHLVGVERSYLGECVGRAPQFTLPWEEGGSIWDGADMWLRPDESRDYVVGPYHQTWQNSDASIDALPLDTEAYVHWWKEDSRRPSLGSLIARVVVETAQHAGTPRSCARASTANAVATTTRSATPQPGRRTSHASKRPPTHSGTTPDRVVS
jgi:hypothetical protein